MSLLAVMSDTFTTAAQCTLENHILWKNLPIKGNTAYICSSKFKSPRFQEGNFFEERIWQRNIVNIFLHFLLQNFKFSEQNRHYLQTLTNHRVDHIASSNTQTERHLSWKLLSKTLRKP